MTNVLLAGATGYLGGYVARELADRRHRLRVIARSPGKLEAIGVKADEVLRAELTDPGEVMDCCLGIDVVISTLGITRQQDGLSYMDVDYQANLNLLREAKRSGVKKFIYVSVLKGAELRYLKICEAKERFVDELRRADIGYCVIRPNGFFKDMSEFLQMARQGRAYVLGRGDLRANPIDGADLATVCVDAIDSDAVEIDVGGPQTLTHIEIAEAAFAALGKKPRIITVPIAVAKLLLFVMRLFTPTAVYGPVEFFLTVMAMDMTAPAYGSKTLTEYFNAQGEP